MKTTILLAAILAASLLYAASASSQPDLSEAFAEARESLPKPFDLDAALEALGGGGARKEAVEKAIADLSSHASRNERTKDALMEAAVAFRVNWWKPVNAMKALAPLAERDLEVQEFMIRIMKDPPSTVFLQDPGQRRMRRTETVRIAMQSLLPLYAQDERVRRELRAVFDSSEDAYALVAVEVFSAAACDDALVQERLLKALEHPRWWVRSSAVRSLGCAAQDKSVRVRLARMLGDRQAEHSAYVREAAARLLRPYCHEPEVAEGMRSALDHQWGGGYDSCASPGSR